MIEPSTKLSGTRAMMAASALMVAAHNQEKAASTLGAEGVITAAESCRELGRWYIEVADALNNLDFLGTPIVRAGA